MTRLLDLIRLAVRKEMERVRSPLLGVVTGVFPHEADSDEHNYEASVRLKHEDLELQKVPIMVDHAGAAAPPREGDLVLVEFVNGDLHQPVLLGRFYHEDDRVPLHRENEVLFEHRLSDGTVNHLRFADDGTIYLQREVTNLDDNSEATATIKIEKNGDIVILADGKKVDITCSKVTVNGDMDVMGDLKVDSGSGSTTISGHEVTGA